MTDKIRALILSDTHVGHLTGIVPPGHFREDLKPAQEERWRGIERLKKYGPFHVIAHGGDAVDGGGGRNGGVERLCAPLEQVDWAYEIFRYLATKDTKYIFLTGGTPYHVRSEDGTVDVERVLADKLLTLCPNVHYRERSYIRFNLSGAKRPFVVLMRHKVSKGTCRNGGAAPGAIRLTQDLLMETIKKGTPRFDMAIYAHVHESHWHEEIVESTRTKLYTTTLPALQGAGTGYGNLMCAGAVNFGALVLELSVNEYGGWDVGHTEVIEYLKSDKQTVVSVHGNELEPIANF